jgi:uncharacterized protein (TIGR03086 family)
MSKVNLGPAARRLAELVARTEDDELGRPTPCPAYTVGDLIEHIGGQARSFAAAARKDRGPYTERAPAGDAAWLPADWRAVIPRDVTAAAAAWAEPAAWAGVTRIAGADGPAQAIGLALADELVVHGWDLARATGRPYDCEPELLDAAEGFLDRCASPDAPAGPDVPFGPARPLPDDACSLDRVIALAGRDPRWAARGPAAGG